MRHKMFVGDSVLPAEWTYYTSGKFSGASTTVSGLPLGNYLVVTISFAFGDGTATVPATASTSSTNTNLYFQENRTNSAGQKAIAHSVEAEFKTGVSSVTIADNAGSSGADLVTGGSVYAIFSEGPADKYRQKTIGYTSDTVTSPTIESNLGNCAYWVASVDSNTSLKSSGRNQAVIGNIYGASSLIVFTFSGSTNLPTSPFTVCDKPNETVRVAVADQSECNTTGFYEMKIYPRTLLRSSETFTLNANNNVSDGDALFALAI